MLAGMAVITSNVTGCPETIGDAGITVAPGDVTELRRVLINLINDAEKTLSLGSKARQRVLENFNWKSLANQYCNLFNQFTNE